jgi:acyl dehydratase
VTIQYARDDAEYLERLQRRRIQMPTTIEGTEGLKEAAGRHLGYSKWREITQEQIQQFADVTGDHQWIHVDVERSCSGLFGGPIAHGYLTLSLGPVLLDEAFVVTGVSMAVNYGIDKLRFPSPVPVGSKVRLGARLLSVEDAAGGIQVRIRAVFEIEGGSKPVCVADIVFRYYP